jgi:hypothetical protein
MTVFARLRGARCVSAQCSLAKSIFLTLFGVLLFSALAVLIRTTLPNISATKVIAQGVVEPLGWPFCSRDGVCDPRALSSVDNDGRI